MRRSNLSPSSIRGCILGALLSCYPALHATGLESDPKQPITIQADAVTFNASNNQARYEGHVTLIQGSLKISASSLTIQNSAEGVNHLIAEGKPARYEQRIHPEQPLFQASAQKIVYYPQSQTIELMEQAQVQQGDSLFQGHRIQYDLKKRVLSAMGQPQSLTTTTSGKSQVKMVIPPNSSKSTQNAPAQIPARQNKEPAL